MANERLRSALTSAGMTARDLGEQIQVDTKTVERWIAETRTPHRSNRQRVALAVGADEAYLWPDAFSDTATRAASLAEVAGIYPNRGSIPGTVWHSLFTQAAESIDMLAYAASFLHDTLADLDEILADKARQGVRVRLVFGDPSSPAVALRGEEEGIGDSLAERCRLTWKYLQPLLGGPGLEVRAHATTLYCSIFRFDDELLANHHLYGAPANHSTVLHLRRLVGGRLFDNHQRSFERVWEEATPATPALLA